MFDSSILLFSPKWELFCGEQNPTLKVGLNTNFQLLIAAPASSFPSFREESCRVERCHTDQTFIETTHLVQSSSHTVKLKPAHNSGH